MLSCNRSLPHSQEPRGPGAFFQVYEDEDKRKAQVGTAGTFDLHH
jgi:hypothetical protein